MVDGLDDVLVVTREVKEAPAFAGGAQLGQDVLAREGHQIVGRIETELGAKVSEHPRCVVFELEVVLGGGDQFVSGSAQRLVMFTLSMQKRGVHTCQRRTCASHRSPPTSILGPSWH